MKLLPLFILVFLSGAGMSLQAGINAKLQQDWAQSPLLAAFISFLVGTLGLLAALVVTRTPLPALSGKFVWWQWTGGLMGAFMVFMAVLSVQRLGAATMFALIVTGQLLLSLALDHYGCFGFAQQSVTLPRLLGVLLVIGGVVLIRKF